MDQKRNELLFDVSIMGQNELVDSQHFIEIEIASVLFARRRTNATIAIHWQCQTQIHVEFDLKYVRICRQIKSDEMLKDKWQMLTSSSLQANTHRN